MSPFLEVMFSEVSEPKILFLDQLLVLKFERLNQISRKFQYDAHNFRLGAPRAKWSQFLEVMFF